MRTSSIQMKIPWLTWLLYSFIAFGGSAIYGMSLSMLFPRWSSSSGALWIIASSGLGWIVLGSGMLWLYRNRLQWIAAAHICLVTMAYGIGVLLLASAVNVAAVWLFTPHDLPLSMMKNMNVTMIVLSNIVMAAVFAKQLRKHTIPIWHALLVWIVLLDGSGALFFWLFERML